MSSDASVLRDLLRARLSERRDNAAPHGAMHRAIFDVLAEARVDWTTVPLEEVKRMLFEGVRAARSASDAPPFLPGAVIPPTTGIAV